MNLDEKKPILQDSGVYLKSGHPQRLLQQQQPQQQYLIIEPIEFDHKHKNLYGYFALVASILILTNYLLIKERTCQISVIAGTNFDLIQSFHITCLIVTILIFVLSYFNFAVLAHDLKLLFYATVLLIFSCSGLLIYNAVAIFSAPCISVTSLPGLANAIGNLDGGNVFSAKDGIGITVFLFSIITAMLLFLAGRSFYRRK